MIFEIININIGGATDDQYEVLENLAKSYREKKHIIWSTRASCDALSKNDNLSLLSRKTFLEIRNKSTQLGSFINTAKLKVQVDFSNTSKEIIETDGWLTISYKLLIDSVSFQKTLFLCEDALDCSFYEIVAHHYAHSHGYNNFRLAFNYLHGGGARTHREYKNVINDSVVKFCVCLIDSDKKHPKGEIGGTAKKFLSEKGTPYAKYKICEFHEIENLLPFRMLRDSFRRVLSKNELDSLEYLEKIEDLGRAEINYLDFKKGLPLNEAFKLDEKHGVFWEKLIRQVKPKKINDKCIAAKECICGKDCMIISGFGDNVLFECLQYMGNLTHIKIMEFLKGLKQSLWFSVGEMLFWWGCAPQGRSATID